MEATEARKTINQIISQRTKNTVNNRHNKQRDSGGFERKIMTEDQRRMKDEAANLKKKLADRNSLASAVQLKVKMIMNKITPENYKSCRKQIEDIMVENFYNSEVVMTIGQTIFKKACIEKKYTSMYSELCVDLTKTGRIRNLNFRM